MKGSHATAALFVVIVLAGGWLRFFDLGGKPIHADEAVQGWKTGVLLEQGVYRYDPTDHHGPTLYYLAAPLAWIAGERNVADLKIRTLRLLPATTGLLLVALTGLTLIPIAGRTGGLCAMLFAAVSPLEVYFSRHFVQEPLFVLFTWLVVWFIWKWWQTRRIGWIAAAGVSFGLLTATKETWPLVVVAMIFGIFISRAAHRPFPFSRGENFGKWLRPFGLAVACAIAVAVLLFSSFFTNAAGVVDAAKALWLGAGRAGDGGHVHPWYFYLSMLLWNTNAGHTWSEAGILAFAAIAVPSAFGGREAAKPLGAFVRFLVGYTAFLLAAYSIIPYKTPWLACGFWHGATILAGLGASGCISEKRAHGIRLLAGAIVLVVSVNLFFQSRQLSGAYSADPRNPYAYVQTSRDLNRLAGRLEAIAAVHPSGRNMIIKVVVPDYWPLPWLLRPYPNTGFWEDIPSDPQADVLLIRADLFAELPDNARDNLSTEFFGLREGAVLVMAVERSLWERSLPPDP